MDTILVRKRRVTSVNTVDVVRFEMKRRKDFLLMAYGTNSL